ncbi:unnamed protein product [Adineta steineri]|uniref:Centriolar satellite-associated tubulin polyglutamylase complex regulator 1 n=1 Tax=Adineta steineri TaxID=433720 RepID=A0A818REJ5_9BILA|nr:unnamed protein product [Adineta steineri]
MADDFTDEQTYLKQHHLTIYFEDCIRSLLDTRRRSSSLTTAKTDVNVLLRDYFQQVKRESHVIGREFTFINSTPYNRRALLTHIWSKYETSIPTPSTLKELHTVILLICPDFPYSLLETSATLLEDIEWSLSVDYIIYLRAFQLKFVYSEFINESQQLFRSFSHRLTCHVPTAEISIPQQNNNHRQLLYEGFEKLITTNTCSCPPLNILDDVLLLLEQKQQLNHQNFLIQLARNEKLTRFIGKEPIIIRPSRLIQQQQQQQRSIIEPIPSIQSETKLTLTSISTPSTRISSPIAPTNLLPPLPKQQLLVREKPIRQGSPASGIIQTNLNKRIDSASSFIASGGSTKSSLPLTNIIRQDLTDTDSDVESVSSGTDT